MLFTGYRTQGFFDEMFDADDSPRPIYADVTRGLSRITGRGFAARSAEVVRHFTNHGITFGHTGMEQTFPFDLVPRIIPALEWAEISAGLVQRVIALDRFLADVYGPRRCVTDGVVPNTMIAGCSGYLRAAAGVTPPGGRHVHLAGIDLVRDDQGTWRVLEDNLRNPSGISYLIHNREFMRRMFPEAFTAQRVEPVDHAALLLRDAVTAAVDTTGQARVVVLTPGPQNSAYAEHAFLAQQMGAELVEGRDLVIRHRRIWLRTTSGLAPVNVIYRRIDDEFLDPAALRPDSLLGVSGLMQAWREGNVTIANAPGNGVADDKAIYMFVPDLIRYYLNEEPILGQVPTFMLDRPEQRAHALANLDQLVVKSVDGAGGYGMLIGPHATPAERAAFALRVEDNPRGYIAQEVVKLSRAPVFVDGAFAARHVDLRPFVAYGDEPVVVPGGLTRVALREGSLVVNSSQGGGSKDTWVVTED
jgi:uncharacterized circularly permuted ATP-grasp superfamily protein